MRNKLMKITTHVVSVNKKERTAKIVASFDCRMFAEIAERSMNEAVKQDWYRGDKDQVFCWVPADRVTGWCISYGYMIID